MLDQSIEHLCLQLPLDDLRSAAEHHYRSIVHRMMKRAARQHQAVDDGHRDAHRRALGDPPQQTAATRAVDVQMIVHPRVDHWHDKRLPLLVDDADVADQRLIDDLMDDLAIVDAALRMTPNGGSLGGAVPFMWSRGIECHGEPQETSHGSCSSSAVCGFATGGWIVSMRAESGAEGRRRVIRTTAVMISAAASTERVSNG